eukprot:gene14058-14176_t
MSSDGTIRACDLPADFNVTPKPCAVPQLQADLVDTTPASFEDAERQAIKNALVAESGNLSRVALRLGISRPTLYRKFSQYGIRRSPALNARTKVIQITVELIAGVMDNPWFHFLAALALGLFIGLERERSAASSKTVQSAGIRTFGLVTLLGALAYFLGGAVLLTVVTAGVAVLAALSYHRSREEDPGLTTEIVLVAAPLLGGLAVSDTLLAAGLGTAVAVALAAKAPLHLFAKRILSAAEMTDGLIFAIATLIIWPQLPDRYMGPLQAINPHALWLLVILVLSLSACGYVATRALGAKFGLPLAGLASGFVSSLATIGSMAGRATLQPQSTSAAVAGAVLSTLSTFVQLGMLLFVISRPTLDIMAPALISGGAMAAVYGAIFTVLAIKSDDISNDTAGRAFSFGIALGLAATMAVMMIAAAALKLQFGDAGVLYGSALAGLVDAHSSAVSVASLVNSGKMSPDSAGWPILSSLSANTLSKIILAFTAGSGRFAARVVPGLVLGVQSASGLLARLTSLKRLFDERQCQFCTTSGFIAMK